ncbi:hypothetical protein M9Y10_018197 [Tritrichomonas musculus]|uniref:Actin n=1 Tax=Tritrichomonas musculus TaxID=1915356 RepID=A0ABR2HN07_9EUKA
MSEELHTIVIDNGSGMMKAGWAGEEIPKSVFPTILSDTLDNLYIGDGALQYRAYSSIRYPIQRGSITDWGDLQKIYDYIFRCVLETDSSKNPTLITRPYGNPKEESEKMIELMFETFNVPSFYTGYQSKLSLCASGRTNGIVLEIGDGITQVMSIIKDKIIPNASTKINFGGADITNYIQRMLFDKGCDQTCKFQTFQEIKEKYCYVKNYGKDQINFIPGVNNHDVRNDRGKVDFCLPDGNTIVLDNERSIAPELLFEPHYNFLNNNGIHDLIFENIQKANSDDRKDLYANIVLSGGSTMFEGLPERIEEEIYQRAPSTLKVKVIAPPERKVGAWFGGSIVASFISFPHMLITKDEYNDSGAAIVNRKCFYY